jgi:hypothetical protein
VLKKDCSAIEMNKKWVLDGVGAILGTQVGQSYGTNREILSDLRPVLAKDGVHLKQMGNVNLSKAIISALEQLRTGKLQEESGGGTGTANDSGISGVSRSRGFFWRGFTSPVGDSVGRVTVAGGSKKQFPQRPLNKHHHHRHQPYASDSGKAYGHDHYGYGTGPGRKGPH